MWTAGFNLMWVAGQGIFKQWHKILNPKSSSERLNPQINKYKSKGTYTERIFNGMSDVGCRPTLSWMETGHLHTVTLRSPDTVTR